MFHDNTNQCRKADQSLDNQDVRALGLPVGFSARADIPTGRPGATPRHRRCNPPLPGMESYFPPETEPPLEFNNSPESLTEKLDRILASPGRRDLSSLTHEQRNILLQWEEEQGVGVGACLNVYPSGEITGGCYSRGKRTAPGRKGKVVSTEFTRQARKTIRRAVDCRTTNFKLFVTLTFDPKLSNLTESGSVDQEWAKEKFRQFLNTLKKKYDRLAEKTGKESWRLSYIWVAEIQEKNTKNIHFHILVDREFIDVKYLVKIWGQASNSVNIKKLNNQQHAVNYMLKYMKKGNSPIQGKRYGMTENLTNGSKPIKYDFYGRGKRDAFLRIKEELAQEIMQNGGYIADWGFSIPTPRRARFWKGRDGLTHESKGTSRKIGSDFLFRIKTAMADIDRFMSIGEESYTDDVPF